MPPDETDTAPQSGTNINADICTSIGDSITVELSFDNRGELVVRLPASPKLKGGNVTLARGTVEQSLRDILDVECKIMARFGKFYGEPSATQMARDIKRANTPNEREARGTAPMLDLEF